MEGLRINGNPKKIGSFLAHILNKQTDTYLYYRKINQNLRNLTLTIEEDTSVVAKVSGF